MKQRQLKLYNDMNTIAASLQFLFRDFTGENTMIVQMLHVYFHRFNTLLYLALHVNKSLFFPLLEGFTFLNR